MTKEEIFEMFDRYDAYETLETGETVQVIHWHDLKHIAEEIVKNCSIPDVVGRSEQLITFSKWKEEKGYNPIYDHEGLVEEYLKSN